MKKICLLIVVLICVNSFVVSAADIEKGFVPSTEIDLTATSVYLKNLDIDKVLYEKNADAKIYPASLTKIMTVVLAIENTADLDLEMVTYPLKVQDYLYEYSLEHGVLSTGGLVAGEERSMREYLYASMLPSANEAAMSIAIHIGGSTEDFAEMMNRRAGELGMENTNFSNPTGLFDENNYTTANDMARLTEHAMSYDVFVEIMETYSYDAGASNKQDSLRWVSTIELQNPELKPGDVYYCEGIKGVKTGTIPESGQHYISVVSRDGFNYMMVLVGCDLTKEKRALIETKAIYNWVFDSFRNKTLVTNGEVVGEVPVKFSKTNNFVQLETSDYLTVLMPDNINTSGSDSQVRKTLVIPEFLEAPVKKGDLIGEYIIEVSGEEVGRIPLVAKDSLSFSRTLKLWSIIKTASSSFWLKFILVLIVLLATAYIILVIIKIRNRRKKNRAFRTKPPKY